MITLETKEMISLSGLLVPSLNIVEQYVYLDTKTRSLHIMSRDYYFKVRVDVSGELEELIPIPTDSFKSCLIVANYKEPIYIDGNRLKVKETSINLEVIDPQILIKARESIDALLAYGNGEYLCEFLPNPDIIFAMDKATAFCSPDTTANNHSMAIFDNIVRANYDRVGIFVALQNNNAPFTVPKMVYNVIGQFDAKWYIREKSIQIVSDSVNGIILGNQVPVKNQARHKELSCRRTEKAVFDTAKFKEKLNEFLPFIGARAMETWITLSENKIEVYRADSEGEIKTTLAPVSYNWNVALTIRLDYLLFGIKYMEGEQFSILKVPNHEIVDDIDTLILLESDDTSVLLIQKVVD